MATKIKVTTEDLETASGSVGRLAGKFGDVGGELKGATFQQVGFETPVALSALAGAWKAALEAMAEDCNGTATRLDHAAAHYRHAERGNAASLVRATRPTTGGGGAHVPIVAGTHARILPDGKAAAPADAPPAVKALIAAGNAISAKPYPDPDVHYDGQNLSQPWPAYDCSGSVSYVLYKAGLHGVDAQVSGQLEDWGDAGPGKWVTVYANQGHTFIKVAGIVFNTVHYAPTSPPGSGPRWQPGSTVAAQIRGDVYGGFVERHPRGL